MAGEMFKKLSALAKQRVTVEGSGVEDYLGNPDEADVFARNAKARAREQQINAEVEKHIKERELLKENYGTTDRDTAQAIDALVGNFNPEKIKDDMALDPAGARARLDRAMTLAGANGVQAAPDGPPQLDRTYYRVNPETGTPEFTNRPEVAAGEGWRVYESRGGTHKDLGEPGGEVGRISAGGTEGQPAGKSLQDIAFEGRVERAKAIVDIPERKAREEVAKGKYFDEVWKRSEYANEVRDSIKEDLERGILKERPDLTLEGLKAVDAAIAKRGRTQMELNKIGRGANALYKRWDRPIEKGPNAGMDQDLSQPATVLNPGGGVNETTKVQQANLKATADAANQLEENVPTERQKMIDFARGKVARQSPTSKVAPGGKGKGLMEDVSGFLAGEGRAGSGESGATGMAKDIAGFYGPRLPGDIMEAIGGVGVKRGLKRGAKELLKIRAIENMFGKF